MSQFAISRWGSIRKIPYVFTELGVAMLSSVLNFDTAIEINMSTMWAFIGIQLISLNHLDDRVG
jgi:hypothetical protein